MQNRQFKMHELDPMFKVKFTYQDGGQVYHVEAPLPEQFGFSVGSEFTATFDANFLAGILQNFKLPFAGGISKRVGVVTTKFYSNPEPTEISFDLEFHAEYSARDEVVIPMATLSMMALGRKLTPKAISEEVDKIVEFGRPVFKKIMNLNPFSEEDAESEDAFLAELEKPLRSTFENVQEIGPNNEQYENALSFIGLISGPPIVTVRFGNVYTFNRVWVSSVTPQFHNVLDLEGLPLSGTCSVTCVLQRDPVVDDLENYFGFEQGTFSR